MLSGEKIFDVIDGEGGGLDLIRVSMRLSTVRSLVVNVRACRSLF